jgi:hypothetical protein
MVDAMSHLLIQTFNAVCESLSYDDSINHIIEGKNYKLAPPYLRELPSELIQHEKEYTEKALPIQTKIVFHLLWTTFRMSYYFGWLQGLRKSSHMPHRKLTKSLFFKR